MTPKHTPLHFVKMGSGLLIAAALGSLIGCTPEPDTSPAVSIISPVNDQTLPVDQPIDVRFMVSGIDGNGPTMIPFQLKAGSMKEFGRGKVRAFINRSNFVAQTASLPNDAAPFMVPDNVNYKATDYLHNPGKYTITLQLYYNGNDDIPEEKVEPQREGTVTVNLQ